MDIQLQQMDEKLDRIESKLDNHLERISKAEESIDWVKGFIKLTFSAILAIGSGIAGWIWKTHS